MHPTIDTRKLLTRAGLTRESVTVLAYLEGATHLMVLNDTRITFYRHAHGAVQVATALQEADGWTLSGWALRLVPRLPHLASELRRPAPLVSLAA